MSVLGWGSAKARKFINLAKVFDGFSPSQLIGIELTTLLSLCSKRYAAVVEQLREVRDITQQLVEQLIKETQAPRKPKQEPISGWKRNPSGSGRHYSIILNDEDTGVSIEQQAQASQVLPHRVIAEGVALRALQKSGAVLVSDYRLAQLEELPLVVDNARKLERENRQLTLELTKRESEIAARERLIDSLEAKLASGVVVPEVEPDGVQTDEVTVIPSNLEALLESLPKVSAPEQITEIEPLMAPPSDCKEPEQKSGYLEPELPGDLWSEKQEDAQDLGAEQNSTLQSGDLVEINVTRPNGDKTWNGSRAYIQHFVAATGKVVVLLQGDLRSKQFFSDELSLVELVGEERQTSVVTEGVDECSPFKDLEAEARPDIADGSDPESEAHTVAKTSEVFPSDAAPDSKLLPVPEQKPQSNRRLQPVEILTTAGEWMGGYFVHACISVGNLVNSDRQFTLFDANGQMHRFWGRIRPAQGCVVR